MATMTSTTIGVNTQELEARVKAMYEAVAREPDGDFHFEMGLEMAERLGYRPDDLARVPTGAIRSFAGVGYHFDLADLREGQTVVDLGSGSGLDVFVAARYVGAIGKVAGIDMTTGQLEHAERLRIEGGYERVGFRRAYIEETGLPSGAFDAVISNGVINLAADKPAVFREAARLLKPGGRLAISDIVTEKPLPPNVTCDATLWAACIGGAMQIDDYVDAIEAAGLTVQVMSANTQYRFLSKSATNAAAEYGVRSISLAAIKR